MNGAIAGTQTKKEWKHAFTVKLLERKCNGMTYHGLSKAAARLRLHRNTVRVRQNGSLSAHVFSLKLYLTPKAHTV